MSESDDHTGVPDDNLLAAEYVLGVLERADRASAARRIERDRAFARLVADWETRFAPWAEEIAPAAPPAAVWDRIAAALPAQKASPADWWESLAFWRGLTVATGALAAASIAALVYFGTLPSQPPLVAALDGGGKHAFVATIDPRNATVLVVPAALAIEAGRVPELWLIAPGGKPRSLGLLNAEKSVTLAIPADLLARTTTQAVLAVSLEPPGGSPTGAPTGPVIAQGKLTNL
jgi:anti-sigma-K factor RskA